MKPSMDEVCKYAEITINIQLRKKYRDKSQEIQDELKQEAFLRVLKSYDDLDVDKGWKAYVQKHVFGAMADYIRSGRDFVEYKQSLHNESEMRPWRLVQRVTFTKDDNNESVSDVDVIAGQNGIYTEENFLDLCSSEFKINWDLVSRLAYDSSRVYVFAKRLLGLTQEEIAQELGVTRERIGQMTQSLLDMFDFPYRFVTSEFPEAVEWINQVIFAFGLCGVYGVERRDYGIGFHNPSIDFSKPHPRFAVQKSEQLLLVI